MFLYWFVPQQLMELVYAQPIVGSSPTRPTIYGGEFERLESKSAKLIVVGSTPTSIS